MIYARLESLLSNYISDESVYLFVFDISNVSADDIQKSWKPLMHSAGLISSNQLDEYTKGASHCEH